MHKGGRSVSDLREIALKYRQLAEDERGGASRRNRDGLPNAESAPMRGRAWIVIALVIASWAALVGVVVELW
jgi:hypothetical protein